VPDAALMRLLEPLELSLEVAFFVLAKASWTQAGYWLINGIGERPPRGVRRQLVQMYGRDASSAPNGKFCLVDRKYEDVVNFGVDQLN